MILSSVTAVQHQTFQNKLIRHKVDLFSALDTHYDNSSILTEGDLQHKTFSLNLMTFHMLNTCTNFMCYHVLSWYCCCVCCQHDLFAVMLHKPQTKILNHLLSHFSYLSRYEGWKIRMKTNPMMCTVNLMLGLNMDSQKEPDSVGVKAIYGGKNVCHTLKHAAVCWLRDGVDVWRHFVPLLPSIHLDDVLRIDG